MNFQTTPNLATKKTNSFPANTKSDWSYSPSPISARLPPEYWQNSGIFQVDRPVGRLQQQGSIGLA